MRRFLPLARAAVLLASVLGLASCATVNRFQGDVRPFDAPVDTMAVAPAQTATSAGPSPGDGPFEGRCAVVNNEDGVLYRWDFRTNTLSQSVVLTTGIGEAYTPTVVGPDGQAYAINNATLFAVGRTRRK